LERLAEDILKKVRALVLFGEAASLLEQAVAERRAGHPGASLELYRSSDLAEAVQIAARVAEPGDVVLLSPACTSFDMYRDFAARGDHFKSLVRELERSQE
jgi:UDP-N-acetylmuramoylalanine--D-glutamate ligase